MIARLSKPLFVTSLALTFTPLVTCEDKDKNANKKSDKEEKKPKVSFDKFTENIGKGDFDELIKSQLNGPLYPLLKFYEEGVPRNIGYGFVMGYTTGLTLKKVSKSISVIIGAFFMGIQYLSFKGYIKVDHETIEKDFNEMLDVNKDGKVDIDDFYYIVNTSKEFFSYQLPTTSGFGTGFIFGLRG